MKLRNKMSYLLPIVGIAFVVLAYGVFLFYESVGREMWFYEKVVVLKESKNSGESIRIDDLEYQTIEASRIDNYTIVKPEEIVGLAAKHFIPKDRALDARYFIRDSMITNQDQKIVRIPNNWIVSVPNTLRRADKVYLYPVITEQDESLTKSSRRYSLSDDNSQTEGDQQEDVSGDEGSGESQENIKTHNRDEVDGESSIEKPLLVTRVAYVKDGANREVKDLSSLPRMEGSSNIAEVNIVATDEDMDQIEKYISKGYKFRLMYEEGGSSKWK